MATDYAKCYNLTNDAIFRTRMQFALWRAARAILTEPSNSENHVKRLAWAKRELRKDSDPDQARIVAIAVTTALSEDDDIQDAAIQGVVDGMINEIA